MEGKWEESASVTGTTTEECGGGPERRQEEVGRVRARKQHPCTHISAGAEGSAASLGEVRIAGAGDSAMQPALKNNTWTMTIRRLWLLRGGPGCCMGSPGLWQLCNAGTYLCTSPTASPTPPTPTPQWLAVSPMETVFLM